jgi:hypothetical protein
MKCVRNILIYTLNVMFQEPVTFKIYLVEELGQLYILLSKKNCGIPYSFLPSLDYSLFYLAIVAAFGFGNTLFSTFPSKLFGNDISG